MLTYAERCRCASISLVFFIIEGTSNVHYLLPIVTTLVSANLVSRRFAPEGVLDLALRCARLLRHCLYFCTTFTLCTFVLVLLQN